MEALQDLSDREKDVVRLLLEGKSNKMIASALHISERTVEFHLKNIYMKTGTGSRVALILKLGDSTVAASSEIPENEDRFALTNLLAAVRTSITKLAEELKMNYVSESNTQGGQKPLTFFESIRTCLIKYADFSGRASRAEFWWFFLFITLAGGSLQMINETASQVFLTAMLLPFLAAGTRRLRDAGKNVWWEFFILVPVGGLVLLGFYWAQPSQAQPEQP